MNVLKDQSSCVLAPVMRFSVWYAVLSVLVAVVVLLSVVPTQEGNVLLQEKGILEAGDATLDDGRFYDSYRFEGQAGQAVIATVSSEEFDTYLLLLDHNDEILIENDDWIDDSNSTIGYVLPSNGRYKIFVTAFEARGHGGYEVSISNTKTDNLIVRKSKADWLNFLGMNLINGDEYLLALELFNEALAISQDSNDQYGIALANTNIGFSYSRRGIYPEALSFYEQALLIYENINDLENEGELLNNIGFIYLRLGQYSKALEFLKRSLKIAEESNNRMGQGAALNNIGLVYHALDQYSEALSSYKSVLNILEESNVIRLKIRVLNNIGGIHSLLNEYTEALNFFERAQAVSEQFDDLQAEGVIFNNIGGIYDEVEFDGYDTIKALDSYKKSLAAFEVIDDRRGRGNSLSNIGFVLETMGYPSLTIIYLKQAVNIFEKIRIDNRVLEQGLQESFTEEVAGSYRKLADLLLQQDRILEAQRVLDLLKVQELDDYLGGARSEATTESGIDLLPQEIEFLNNQDSILDQAIPIATELKDLRKIPFPNRTTEQNDRIQFLEAQQSNILDQFLGFIASDDVQQLITQLSRAVTDPDQDILTELNQFPTLRDNLRDIGNAVLFYPLILDDRLELVLVTADGRPPPQTGPQPRDKQTPQN